MVTRCRDFVFKKETLDNGKPLAEAAFDMTCAVNCLRYYGNNYTEIFSPALVLTHTFVY